MEGLPFNVVDIAVLLVLLLSGILAYVRGFVHEVLSVAGWVGAILATVFGYPHLRPVMRDLIPMQLAADLTTGVAIFIVTLVVLSLVTRGVSSRVKESALNVLDRSLGFLFGLVRGAVLVCIAYIGLELVVPPEEHPAWIAEARTMPLIVAGRDAIVEIIPESVGMNLKRDGEESDDAEGNVDALISPQTEGQNTGESGAYDEEARQELDRLIDNVE